MLISLHKNATTTPATRLALQQATGTDRELGNLCISPQRMCLHMRWGLMQQFDLGLNLSTKKNT